MHREWGFVLYWVCGHTCTDTAFLFLMGVRYMRGHDPRILVMHTVASYSLLEIRTTLFHLGTPFMFRHSISLLRVIIYIHIHMFHSVHCLWVTHMTSENLICGMGRILFRKFHISDSFIHASF